MSPRLPTPMYTAPGDALARRMLLVSVAYPPNSEVGSLRWTKIAQAAHTKGWTIDVILIDPADASLRDVALLREVPAGARLFDVPLRDLALQRAEALVRRVVRRWRSRRVAGATRAAGAAGAAGAAPAGANEGHGHAAGAGTLGQLLRAYRARLHFAQWHDWASRAALTGVALATETPYALIASSGPPHYAHEAARRISVTAGRPLVIDLRDPWFSDDVEPMALRGATWRHVTSTGESSAVAQSSLVVVNTDSCRHLMIQRYPTLSDRFLTIMNGADPDVAPAQSVATDFVISHTGSLYSGRNPRVLFRAVALVVARIGIRPGELRIHFMGDDVYDGRPLRALAAECGVGDFTTVERRRPRSEALALIQASAMVVLLPQQHVHSIPGKLFEYVQLAAWPLVIADRGSATELLLRDSGADVVSPDDVDGVADAIEQRFLAFRRGERPVPLNADGRFNRDRQTAKLLDALDLLA